VYTLNQVVTEYGLTVSAHKTKLIAFQKTLQETRTKLYITLALPALLYGSENWTITARDARRMTAADIKYTRKTAGCNWTDYKTSTDTVKELNITPVLDKIQEYRKNRLQRVNKMLRFRLARILKTTDQQAEDSN
jgi:hypothetical protein